ncbi:beta family protein [Streptomyces sp. NPDC006639]|uniref:beta family protein n=1 Tax=Streptomyces sp. NPDC006639 TaxID=3364753 RepID=UPI0036A20411
MVLAGSVPRVVTDLAVGEMTEPHRFDWDIWHMMLHAGASAGEAVVPLVTYGDYGAQHTRGADQSTDRRGGQPWGLLRYTTERTFLLAKAATVGEEWAAGIRSLARQIVETQDYRGARFSDGDCWLDRCARGTSKAATGDAEAWLQAGHSQHMTYVVGQLREAG